MTRGTVLFVSLKSTWRSVTSNSLKTTGDSTKLTEIRIQICSARILLDKDKLFSPSYGLFLIMKSKIEKCELSTEKNLIDKNNQSGRIDYN